MLSKFTKTCLVAAAGTAILAALFTFSDSHSTIPASFFVILILFVIQFGLSTLSLFAFSRRQPSHSSDKAEAQGYSLGGMIIQIVFMLIYQAPFWVYFLWKDLPISAFGLTLDNMGVSLAFGIALIFTTAFFYHKPLVAERYAWGAAFAVGFSEEFILRGFLQNYLASQIEPLLAWIVVAAYFAIYHIPQRLLIHERKGWRSILKDQPELFLFGLVAGGMALTFHSIVAPIILHTAIDWAEFTEPQV
jgi:membrane protease YdiL (CAAX protease family)